ncbi:GSU2403 family nucleotidyltransferase fold protein [Xenophilus arseniciresistens]|uniref:GSU2403 family nucleotidyltransferase fold protein n=1 Tax=Xenophilus arseniciresistens TaxID=1283306 RepID=A0AAE3SXU0_9BURK|nr:GSU2403 family nucleotidyltransferase fold protein [Xenophilus arseniciresistens]MDA7414845.1 GSU2403 family nucleotidyltransferase fold protein [Xenophilus arseniciresistens]
MNQRKTQPFQDIGDDARRQYIDARAAFEALEAAQAQAATVRGGMYWKTVNGSEYLIRTSAGNAQKSLGPRSAETEAMQRSFAARKAEAEARLKALKTTVQRHQRLNRALYVGRVPAVVVDILNMLHDQGVAQHFTVVGTHAVYAYEAAAGVRVESAAVATRDVDLLWDTRKRFKLATQLKRLDSSMLALLRKVDKSFALVQGQLYTAVNSQGFEVDILRREQQEQDPHPAHLSETEEDFWVVQARNAEQLVSAQRFSAIVVAASGQMARMHTVHPLAFVKFKRWLGQQPDRDPLKVERDHLQADTVARLVEEYLPQLLQPTA